MITLYSYYRSSCSYRVRIALNLKNLNYHITPINLAKGHDEQFDENYNDKNPQSLVPMLEDGPIALTQSLAIIEYLDERYPEPAILPKGAVARARVRSLSQIIACDIQPLNNQRVLKYLETELRCDDNQKNLWYHHWITQQFQALEIRLARSPDTGICCHGDRPTMVDMCLVPQVYNAQRFGISLDDFPTIKRVTSYCQSLPSFAKAHPDNQIDSPQ